VSPSSVPGRPGGGSLWRSRLSRLAKATKDAESAIVTTFRINTCKSVSKQTTLTTFRINTYEKPGEGVPPATHSLLGARVIGRRLRARGKAT
jgi:hypothetical protein